MPNNLQTYHKTLTQLCQWLPKERITRLRNMALLMLGLQLSGGRQSASGSAEMAVAGKNTKLDEPLAPFFE